MDALEYKQWQEAFQAKARNATDDEIEFALADIREEINFTVSAPHTAQLLLERGVYITEAGKRAAVEFKNAGRM